MNLFVQSLVEAWRLLVASSPYIVFGLLVGGWLKVFLNPGTVARHFGRGRLRSVFKAALFGIPIPLCSCGVLPAALALKKQGANNGATTAFMISTPESGVDSIAVTYALMDPLMTVARPVAAFVSAALAGIAENLFAFNKPAASPAPMLLNEAGHHHHNHDHATGDGRPLTLCGRLRSGLSFAFGDFWGELAGWFFVGLLLAGFITALIPDDIFTRYLGEGLAAMLLMLLIGLPIYICSTASTPIAAALVLKGVSPGAALVFLLAGPATNMTTLTVLAGILGRRATVIYLSSIAVCTVFFGLLLNRVYSWMGFSAQATMGHAAELMPGWVGLAGALFLLLISVKPLEARLKAKLSRLRKKRKRKAGEPEVLFSDSPCDPT